MCGYDLCMWIDEDLDQARLHGFVFSHTGHACYTDSLIIGRYIGREVHEVSPRALLLDTGNADQRGLSELRSSSHCRTLH